LTRLKGEVDIETSATMGMNVEKLKIGDVFFLACDLGGQIAFAKSVWEPYVRTSDGIVFVFDSADPDCVKEAGIWLDKVSEWTKKAAIFMFLANKRDLPESKEPKEIIELLNLSKVMAARPHTFMIYYVSALKGDGVDEAWNWFSRKMLELHSSDTSEEFEESS
ncbi:MAG: ADP-ribosylation factor-like protein, partial [Promethearchaeota archaeon]